MSHSYFNISFNPPDVMALFRQHGPEEFDRLVVDGRRTSLSIHVPYARGQGIRSSYGGQSASRISRMAQMWKDNPRSFEDSHPASVVEGVKAFLEDDERDAREAERVLKLCQKEQLPPLPQGYRWESSGGGLGLSDHQVFYRVWHPKLGYMPIAE